MSSTPSPRPNDAVAAVRGERIPPYLGPPGTLSRACLIRGIRFHDGFATELHGDPASPDITRALNARAIMSNRIPAMQNDDEFPYCIWHPDLPAEATLRQLLTAYPGRELLRYQVGRTCAAAGYTALYEELELLPDVAIAEEARDNVSGGQAIYASIMGRAVRYACMDDYQRSLRDPVVAGACLNGDTCVRSALAHTQSCTPPSDEWVRAPYAFDITEDWSVGETGMRPQARTVDAAAVRLLAAPLPADLPTTDKDLLVLMAAWTGNLDRYARLRRPRMVAGEAACVARGLLHHPLFAAWWDARPDASARAPAWRRLVHARRVMSNDLSWLPDPDNDDEATVVPDDHLPRLLGHPHHPAPPTYLELARRRPVLTPYVAAACIHADYQSAFDELEAAPTASLWRAASASPNPHYQARVERRLAAEGRELSDLFDYDDEEEDEGEGEGGQLVGVERANGGTLPSTRLFAALSLDHVGFAPEGLSEAGTYDVGDVLLHVLAAPAARPLPPFAWRDLAEVYRDAAYVEVPSDRALVGIHPNPAAPVGGYRAQGRGTSSQ